MQEDLFSRAWAQAHVFGKVAKVFVADSGCQVKTFGYQRGPEVVFQAAAADGG